MYYNKHPYPANFEFVRSHRNSIAKLGKTNVQLAVTQYEDDIYRIGVACPLWPGNYSQAELAPPPRRKGKGAGRTRLQVDGGWGMKLTDAGGEVLLASPTGRTFGLCGRASMFIFTREDNCQFYGMGEKVLGLELSDKRVKFWNTDMWADFDSAACEKGRPDPLYVSIPYLIVKRGNTYVGLLLNNPYATFMCTSTATNIAGQLAVMGEQQKGVFWLGSEDGLPELFIIVGPSLAELTRKLQKLVGVTPMPPAWALGYHQSRWGYRSAADLDDLDAAFRKHKIPCDGLFFDIDYMDGYRVFTFDKQHFPAPSKAIRSLARRRRHAVPILDPGVKLDPGYQAYDDGVKAGIFCRNPQGSPYVGLVWPGETVFPDFSTAKGRKWWADNVKRLSRNGLGGAWIDMNDPATGHSDNMQMLFNDGKDSHDTFHNQYAMGMARATREGFLAAHPNERPFVLSRSGFIGSGRYTAVWTGDNSSNYHWLKLSIPCSLNLALSGIPFNGSDVGGFAGNVTPELMIVWTKAAFLMPFFRNHSGLGHVRQEPWIFDSYVTDILREYIRLRYKFRPYLYNLFAAHEQTGEAVVRPLFYDFPDTPELPLGLVDDQFMAGPFVMHAPILASESSRQVVLPHGQWYCVMTGGWVDGGSKVNVNAQPLAQTPLYFRDGGIVPMAQGEIMDDNTFDGSKAEFHVFLNRKSTTAAQSEYVFDDGISFDYQKGLRSRVSLRASVDGGTIDITAKLIDKGYGRCHATFILYDNFDSVRINGKPAKVQRVSQRLAGSTMQVVRARPK